MYQTVGSMESIRAVTKKLVLHPAFFLGLIIKVALIVYVRPTAAEVWYLPFIAESLNQLSLDPWRVFIDSGGRAEAFPYGYAMLLIFLPLTFLLGAFGLEDYYGYGFTLLVVDIALLGLLKVFFQLKERFFAPRVLVVSHHHFCYLLGRIQ